MAKIFISYSRRDQSIVEEFYNQIKGDGHDVWYDKIGIHAADLWMANIEKAIEQCDVFLYFSSVNSNTEPSEPQKEWYTQIEVKYAIDQFKTIIPIVLDDTPFPYGTRAKLKPLHHIEYKSLGFQESYNALKIKFKDLFKSNPKQSIIESEYDRMIDELEKDVQIKTLKIVKEGIKSNHIPKSITINVGNISFEMVLVKGGNYIVGENLRRAKESSSSVQLADYYIGKFTVTQQLWKLIMERNPSRSNIGKMYPVENVSWDECWDFIERLNEITDLSFSIPNEAQWEFAARGGLNSEGFIYSGSNSIDDVAWYRNFDEQTHEVGLKKPNELGIYDMSGNVNEWCLKGNLSFSQTKYKKGAIHHVLRGGSFASTEKNCEIFSRQNEEKLSKTRFWGLRLILEIPKD